MYIFDHFHHPSFPWGSNNPEQIGCKWSDERGVYRIAVDIIDGAIKYEDVLHVPLVVIESLVSFARKKGIACTGEKVSA